LIKDTTNGIEQITTLGSVKDKIQIKLKTNSDLVVDTSGLTINYDSTNFRLGTGQTDNDKLKIRVEDNMGIGLGDYGLKQNYLIKDDINGIERINTTGTDKDKIQSRILSTGGLEQGSTEI